MQNFTLINSIYTAEDAKEVLVSLINNKISSLQQLSFGIHEREGRNSEHIKKRIDELRTMRTELIDKIKGIEDGSNLKVSAQIELEVVENEVTVYL